MIQEQQHTARVPARSSMIEEVQHSTMIAAIITGNRPSIDPPYPPEDPQGHNIFPKVYFWEPTFTGPEQTSLYLNVGHTPFPGVTCCNRALLSETAGLAYNLAEENNGVLYVNQVAVPTGMPVLLYFAQNVSCKPTGPQLPCGGTGVLPFGPHRLQMPPVLFFHWVDPASRLCPPQP